MHLREVHSVGFGQAGQAVRATDEVWSEPRAQPAGGAGEIAQRGEMERIGETSANGDRIRVLEAERWQPSDAVASLEFGRDAGVHRGRVAKWLLAEDGEESRSGVFGIDID